MTLVGEAVTGFGAGADLRAGLATLGVSTSRLATFWMSTLPPESMGTVMVALGSRCNNKAVCLAAARKSWAAASTCSASSQRTTMAEGSLVARSARDRYGRTEPCQSAGLSAKLGPGLAAGTDTERGAAGALGGEAVAGPQRGRARGNLRGSFGLRSRQGSGLSLSLRGRGSNAGGTRDSLQQGTQACRKAIGLASRQKAHERLKKRKDLSLNTLLHLLLLQLLAPGGLVDAPGPGWLASPTLQPA